MAIDPGIFPLEDLVLERLYSNLVESEDTVGLLEDLTVQDDWDDTEIAKYEARLAEEQDKVVLLKELISRKRRSEMEKL